VTLSSVATTYPYSLDLSTLVGGGSGTGAFSYTLLSGGTASCVLTGSVLTSTTSAPAS